MAARRTQRSIGSLMRSMFAKPRRRGRRAATPTFPLLIPLPAPKPTRTAAPKPARTPAPKPAAKVPAPKGPGTWLRVNHRGPAGARSYFVYVPSGLRRTRPVPLVVLLHGCRQTPAEFAAATRFNQLADRNGFIAVYPEQGAAHQQHHCWRWYEPAHQVRGSGEPALLAAITREVSAERDRWRVDPTRVYVAGLSAGGAMALILGATYPDLFAAVGVHSAPAYRSASSANNAFGAMAGRTELPPPVAGNGLPGMPPAIVFQGTLDNTVHARNGHRVSEQWLAFQRAYTVELKHPDRISRTATAPGRSADGRRYSVSRWYTARGHKVLEYWLVEGLGHAWSGGSSGSSYCDPKGPRASTAMWRFFATKQLPAGMCGTDT